MSYPLTSAADPAGTDMHILTPGKAAIRGTLETIAACGRVENLHVEADGSLGFDFDCWAEQWFEDARPVERPHPDTQRRGFVFVDFSGSEHHEDDLLRCLPGARIIDCPYCQAAARPLAERVRA